MLIESRANNKRDGVIIISEKNEIDERVAGLQFGADDYLSKPFHLSELSARIAAVMRRRRFDGAQVLVFEPLLIDLAARSVRVNEHVLNLTPLEYNLLIYLVSNKNKIIKKVLSLKIFQEKPPSFLTILILFIHILKI